MAVRFFCLPDNAIRAYNMYEVIRGIVDGGDYLDSQPLFATNMITCFARINKRAVGSFSVRGRPCHFSVAASHTKTVTEY